MTQRQKQRIRSEQVKIRMYPELADRLRVDAVEQGVTVSTVIRRILQQHYEE